MGRLPNQGSDNDARHKRQADEGPGRRPSGRRLRARFGGRRARGIALHFRKLITQTREVFIGARDLFVGVRELFIGAREQGIAGFICFWSGCGVHRRLLSLFHPMPSDGDGRLSGESTGRQHSVQSCPKNGGMMERRAI
jgi:hypothetical protein